MTTFYYKYDLPKGLNEILMCCIEKYKNDGILTFEFSYIYNSESDGCNLTIKGIDKKFMQLSRRPIESLCNLGFGTLGYKNIRRFNTDKNYGFFTLSKTAFEYEDYLNKNEIGKWKLRLIESVKENDVPITLIVSIIALIVSFYVAISS